MDYKVNKEAVDKIIERVLDNGSTVINKNDLEEMFPELEESEDERIRKALIRYYSFDKDGDSHALDNITPKQILAWLEKQGEQKPVDLVAMMKDYFANTPKEQQEKDWAELKHLNDVGFGIEIPFGAKDSELQEVSYYIPEGFHAEIESNRVVIKRGEQKPAWSEEDEKLVKNLISTLSNLYARNLIEKETKEKYTNLLKSLKERVQPQPQKEWSEEDDSILQGIWDEILANKHNAKKCEWKTYDKFLDWLKSLRPQNRWKPSDEQMMCLDSAIREYQSKGYPAKILESLYEQLKAL